MVKSATFEKKALVKACAGVALACGAAGYAMSSQGVLSDFPWLATSVGSPWSMACWAASYALAGGAICFVSNRWAMALVAKQWAGAAGQARALAVELGIEALEEEITWPIMANEPIHIAKALAWARGAAASKEQSKRQAESMFEALSTASGQGMILCDSSSKILRSNAKLEQFAFGAKHLAEIAQLESQKDLGDKFAAAASDMARCRWEGWIGSQSEERRGSISLVPLGIQEGGENLYVGHVQDISERRRMEDRLAFERNKAERVMEAVNDAVMLLDAYGHIEKASAGMLALLGKSMEQVKGLWVGRVLKLSGRLDGKPAPIEELLAEDQIDSDQWMMEQEGAVRTPMEIRWRRLREESFEGVLSARDITTRLEQLETIKWEAEHDALTGLMNRRGFDLFMEQARLNMLKDGKPAWVLMMDLDGFKKINDRFGHDVGDAILKMTAQALLSLSAPGDGVARLGGDEFAVWLDNVECSQAKERCAWMKKAIEGGSIEVEGQLAQVGASIGCSELVPGDASGADAMKRADDEMYKDKRSQGDRLR
jgi:diguanylate cyclase (GGDEF)-like protein